MTQGPINSQILASGLESTVYRLSSNGVDLILKKKRRGGKQHYPFEAFAYEQAKRAGASVPSVLFADDDLLLMTALKGQEMDDREQLFADSELFAHIANDLAKCHSIQLPGFGEPITADHGSFKGKQPNWQAYLSEMQPILDNLVVTNNLSGQDLQRLRSFWKQELSGIQLSQGTLVHGDFAMTAIFVDGKTYTGLIDFGDALIGDPLMDLAYFRLKEISKPYGVSTYQLLIAAYTKAAGINWNNTNDNTMLLYMIFWALRRLQHCPDESLRIKFYDKLHKVAELT